MNNTSFFRFYTLFVLGLVHLTVSSQNLLFDHLGVREGLSQLSVNAIYQDEYEQIWIATRDGLNKYDGNRVESFRPTIDASMGILGSSIKNVTGDRQGKLYIQWGNGLGSYDLKYQKFEAIDTDNINCISYGKSKLWIGSRNEIKFLDTSANSLVPYLALDSIIWVSSILEGSSGNLYVGTQFHGLFEVDNNGKISSIIEDIRVECIFEDKQRRIWVGSASNGLFCVDNQRNIKNYIHKVSDDKSISNNSVRAICQDNLGLFWIGTANGLNHFNLESQEFKCYSHSYSDVHSISNQAVWSIIKDAQGSIWIGTYSGGLNIINPEYSFNNYYRATNNRKGLNNSIVSNVAEEENGNLWIGTDNEGLNYFDRASKTFSYFTHSSTNKNSLSSNIIKATLIDNENNCLWVGTNQGGLDKIDLTTKKVVRINPLSDSIKVNEYVRSLAKYDGKILLGTHSSIQVYDPQSNTIKYLLGDRKSNNNRQIWDMIVDSNNCLWFSRGGTYRYDLEKGTLQKYMYTNHISNKEQELLYSTFFEDSKKRIWVGSANKGLGLYNAQNDSIVFYNTDNSNIMDNYILDIGESPMGYILVATNKGLSRLDVEKEKFGNYYNSQFFPFDAFNERSIFTSRSGEIILSSLNGMLILTEHDFMLNTKDCRINITALRVNNKLIVPNDESGILKESIISTDKIILNSSHSVFSIELATSNYIKALQPKIQYKLEGFDEQWIDIQDRNVLNYTNLSPAKYTLRIRGSEKSTQYEIPERQLEIIIEAPFYKTWYAYIVYVLMVLGIMYLILSQVKLRESLKYADDEKKHIEELNQYKLRFFTNISHEIRTPITLIISQLEMLLQREDIPQTIQNRLSNISKNAGSLKNLIGELLDFRKQSQGYTKLKASEQDIVKYLEDIFYSFKDFANHKQINTFFLHQEESIDVWFDAQQLHKVFFNLLSNAFKFTPSKGSVSVSIERQNDTITISVSDTGVGIKKEDINKLFERFYQGEYSMKSSVVIDSGTGIGLALAKSIVETHKGTISVQSDENTGSIFSVSLPLGSAHLIESEKVSATDLHSTYLQDVDDMASKEFVEEMLNDSEQSIDSDISILIIEDNQELLQILTELFQPLYKVYTAIDGSTGFEKAIELHPSLILSDIMMPEMSGIELCKKIKTNIDICHIPVVLLTARTEIESNMEGLLIGADDYITKPFNSKMLISRCNNLINNRILTQKKFMSSPDLDTLQLAVSSYDQQLLNKAIEIIEGNICNPSFDIALFAKEMYMGRSSLFSKIKGLTGQTPRDFITTIRLKKSQSLLKDNLDMSVSDIAFKLGFSDASYFIKVFRQSFGTTPKQFRQNRK